MSNQRKPDRYGTSLHYFGEMGSEYLKYQDVHGVVNGMINARKFESLDMANSIVLDFGAGTGNLLMALKPKKAIAIEINPHAVEKLVARGIETYPDLDSVKSESIDLVISNHALEHVPYPISAIAEIHRVLKPGGRARICVPIDDWRTEKKFVAGEINNHLHTWTPQLLGNTLRESGFDQEDISIRILTHAWFPGYHRFYRFPFFDVGCFLHAILRKRRQILADIVKK